MITKMPQVVLGREISSLMDIIRRYTRLPYKDKEFSVYRDPILEDSYAVRVKRGGTSYFFTIDSDGDVRDVHFDSWPPIR